MSKQAFIIALVALLAGCGDIEGNEPRSILAAEIQKQQCDINFAALPIMRENGILPDPDMLAGCEIPDQLPEVDLEPRPEVDMSESEFAPVVYEVLVSNRMNSRMVDRIYTSAAFADLVALYERRANLTEIWSLK